MPSLNAVSNARVRLVELLVFRVIASVLGYVTSHQCSVEAR